MIPGVVKSISSLLGYRPVGRDWAARLPHLNGHFRRNTSEKIHRLLYGAAGLFVAVAIPVTEMSRPGSGDLHEPFLQGALVTLVIISGWVLWPLTQSYVIRNVELSCVLWNGRVLWREDLAGLEYVTCSTNRGISRLVLKWPQRRRRMELFESLERAMQLHTDNPRTSGRPRSDP
jgi:hypothetical protein